MAVTSFEHFSLDVLHKQFVGKQVERLDGPYTLYRSGIITDVIRNKWGTEAVILWDTDHEYEDVSLDNDSNDREDLRVQDSVCRLTLNTITCKFRWRIGGKEENTQHD